MGGTEAVVEKGGDAGAPGGLDKLGKLGELGGRKVALLEAELGAVEGLQVDGGEIGAAPDPRLLEAPHHVAAHGGLALGVC